MFSRSCQYALQAMVFLAMYGGQDKRVGLSEIARRQGIPKHFLSKILQMLVKHRLLDSMKGPTGGFYFEVPPEKITLMQIVQIIDGPGIFDKCGMGFKKCSDENPCPIHHDYKKVKKRIKKILRTKTLTQLVEDIKAGKSFVAYPEKTKKEDHW